MFEEYDPRGNWWEPADPYKPETLSGYAHNPMGGQYLGKYAQMYTFKGINQYKLPDMHHLDLGISFGVKHEYGESILGISVYNVYNHMNVSSAYIGYDKNQTVLKGVCIFPIMPSVSYTHKF